jgi:hypothetical protein
MKYTVEMGSGVMASTPNSIKIGSANQKLIGGYTDTQTAWRFYKPNFISHRITGLFGLFHRPVF